MTPCQHRELKWSISAQTSVMAVQTTVWGVECVGCGRKWDVGQVMQAVVDLTASQERVRELEMRDEAWESTMREIANSGVEFEDERVGYVTVQIDRDIWLSLAALRGPSTAGATGEQGLEERT